MSILKRASGVSQAFVKSTLPRLTGGCPEPPVSEATMVAKGWGQEGSPDNQGAGKERKSLLTLPNAHFL